MIDILVLNYNDANTTLSFINSVVNYDCVRIVLAVDNHSSDNSFDALKSINNKKVMVIQTPKNGGYGYGNNYGVSFLSTNYLSKYILVCNPDVLIDEKVIQKMEDFLCCHDEYAMVAPFMVNASKEKQFNTAFRIPSKREYIDSIGLISLRKKRFYYSDINNWTGVRDVGALTGSLFLCRVDAFLSANGFDEKIFLFCEEIVLGMRIKQLGFKVALFADDFYIHNHSVSISKTYKSIFKRHSLFLKSKMYVIKEYYKSNMIDVFRAKILASISYLELWLVGIFRKKR